MSEDHTELGALRRRPRTTHQRSSRNGQKTGANGSYRKNGHSTRGPFQASAENERRERRREDPREAPPWEEAQPRRALTYNNMPAEPEEDSGFKFPFDPWRLFAAVKRHWGLILTGATLVAVIGLALAVFLIQYRVTVPLMRKTSNAFRVEGTDQFAPREYSDQTLYTFMKSGEVLRRVTAKASTNAVLAPLQITPRELAKAVSVKPAPNPDMVLLSVKAFGGLGAMVELANVYAGEVVDYTREIQQMESAEITRYLEQKLMEADGRIQALTEELKAFAHGGFVDFERQNEADIKQLFELQYKRDAKQMELETIEAKINVRQGQMAKQTPVNAELQKAEEELRLMLLNMKDAHPAVAAQRRRIEMLKSQQGPATNDDTSLMSNNPLYHQVLDLQSERPGLQKQIQELNLAITNLQKRLFSRAEDDIRYAMKKGQLQSEKAAREMLNSRHQQAKLFTENALGYFSVFSPATMNSVNFSSRWLKVALTGLAAGVVGLLASILLVMLCEAMDTSLKTPEDVTRVTGLPVLATLGDLRKMSAAAQVNWAFRTLTVLRGRLSADPDQALVCGIISSTHGEGRSTWVNLLVSAASQRGLRVLTVDTRPTAAAPETSVPNPPPQSAPEAEQSASTNPSDPEAGFANQANQPDQTEETHLPAQPASPFNGTALTTPDKVAEQLRNPNSQPVVHIPLPGWIWNLERRKQWQKALDYWRQIDNLVIFVELPPASEPEAVLLAEHLPQLIWLTGSGKADAAETATQVEILRHARCNLVGAVMNHAPPPVLNTRIARWFTKMTGAMALVGMLHGAPAFAQNEALTPASQAAQSVKSEEAEPLVFSGGAKRKRAAWQERLTFGPGDTMDIHFYGNPALSRTNIFVGPDGRISYLQAQNVVAAGLTVEELRSRLDEELASYYTAPRTIVLPVSFTSKKYFMLGKINGKGAYVLDRPLTLLEAVARAKGLETGLYQRTSVEMADLSRSFIVRGREKLPVNFERLFLDGDLSQNISIEPNDYIFFASTAMNDIYVLGEVVSPGPIGFLPNATAVTAIADRGGFSEKAYKKRVLVIRGSLNEPETFVVDTGGVLEARSKDFKLQPKDIVYVSQRPWVKAEELLDEAASSFIQGAVTTWAGVNVGPIIKSRLLPRARPRGE